MNDLETNILLSGNMRSGTTLMCSILDAHPGISILSDLLTWYWKYCFPRFPKIKTDYELNWAMYELEPHINHHHNNIDMNRLIHEVKKKGISNHSLYETLLEQLYYGEPQKIRGIKATHSVYQYETFLNEMKNSYVIHMVRNCRDVYFSHKNRVMPKPLHLHKIFKKKIGRYFFTNKVTLDERIFNPFLNKNPIRMMDDWAITNTMTLKLKEKYPKKVIIVKFEDLLSKTEETIKYVLDQIGAFWQEDFYNYSKLKDRNGKQFTANTSFGNRKIQEFSSKYVFRSVDLLTDIEKKYFEKVARKTELKMGYQFR